MFEIFKNKLMWLSYFIEPVNYYSESFITLYNLICMYLIIVVVLISYWMTDCVTNFSFKKKQPIYDQIKKFFFSGQNSWLRSIFYLDLTDRVVPYIQVSDVQEFKILEAIWGSLPLGFIGVVSYPSVSLEYGLSPDIFPTITVKVIAVQWAWIVQISSIFTPALVETSNSDHFLETPLFKIFEENKENPKDFFDALENLNFWHIDKDVSANVYTGLSEDNNLGRPRLLSIYETIVLPVNQPIRFIVTSRDVLHSFALPAVSVKMDAVPGRVTTQILVFERPGFIWGQCSELCGPFHAFMPINFNICDMDSFVDYMLDDNS